MIDVPWRTRTNRTVVGLRYAELELECEDETGPGVAEAHHAVALVLDGAYERGEVRQAAPNHALVLGLRGADARELELLHARRQRQLSCAQPCGTQVCNVFTLRIM